MVRVTGLWSQIPEFCFSRPSNDLAHGTKKNIFIGDNKWSNARSDCVGFTHRSTQEKKIVFQYTKMLKFCATPPMEKIYYKAGELPRLKANKHWSSLACKLLLGSLRCRGRQRAKGVSHSPGFCRLTGYREHARFLWPFFL